tara:strand:- start:616 stop:810 length:195 start_codon:yes stop_codon:yes gene_type:complete
MVLIAFLCTEPLGWEPALCMLYPELIIDLARPSAIWLLAELPTQRNKIFIIKIWAGFTCPIRVI